MNPDSHVLEGSPPSSNSWSLGFAGGSGLSAAGASEEATFEGVGESVGVTGPGPSSAHRLPVSQQSARGAAPLEAVTQKPPSVRAGARSPWAQHVSGAGCSARQFRDTCPWAVWESVRLEAALPNVLWHFEDP